ncbi:MAG: 2-oxoglutarate and iron-dependent oxygenase domain-containing protein [Pseudomonadota bacterium]
MRDDELIPRIDARALVQGQRDALRGARRAATETGFMTVHNTPFSSARMWSLVETYRSFFKRPEADKRAIDMALTGSNRGWGASGGEQVNPRANPDYKQVFDCGLELAVTDPVRRANLTCYAPNLWPSAPAQFAQTIQAYYRDVCAFAHELLAGIVTATGGDAAYFAHQFTRPMALLRGNFYPSRPTWAGADDFGIATHTDYGCLTLLATDGSPGLEVKLRDGSWQRVTAPPDEFVVNFGEMLEIWTDGNIVATPHRVIGGLEERISVPLFFNPNHDTNVAPRGSDEVILAGEHLARRFNETYVHLQRRPA